MVVAKHIVEPWQILWQILHQPLTCSSIQKKTAVDSRNPPAEHDVAVCDTAIVSISACYYY